MDRIKQEDVPQGAPLRMRHRSNGGGAWVPLSALTDRPPRVGEWVIEASVRGEWVRVAFRRGAPKGVRTGGARAGAGRKPRLATL